MVAAVSVLVWFSCCCDEAATVCGNLTCQSNDIPFCYVLLVFLRLASEKERQLTLARDRIAKRRKKKAGVVSTEELAEQLAEDSKNATVNDGGFYALCASVVLLPAEICPLTDLFKLIGWLQR